MAMDVRSIGLAEVARWALVGATLAILCTTHIVVGACAIIILTLQQCGFGPVGKLVSEITPTCKKRTCLVYYIMADIV